MAGHLEALDGELRPIAAQMDIPDLRDIAAARINDARLAAAVTPADFPSLDLDKVAITQTTVSTPTEVRAPRRAVRWCSCTAAPSVSAADELGVDRRRIAVGGQSAGACLAAAAALHCRDHSGTGLRAQMLLFPVTDHPLHAGRNGHASLEHGAERVDVAALSGSHRCGRILLCRTRVGDKRKRIADGSGGHGGGRSAARRGPSFRNAI